MHSNSFGISPRVTIFGQSHDPEIGARITGLPAGMHIDHDALEDLLERRRPGKSALTTPRKETDAPHIVSGITDGVLDGSALSVVFHNSDTRNADYERFKTTPRPSHADYVATQKYGDGHSIAGGGRFSGRLTLPLCYAGALCLQVLHEQGIEVTARLVEVGGSALDIEQCILDAAADGNSVGGIIELTVTDLPAGIGEHPFAGVEPVLSQLFFAIPGVRGVEFGAGFRAATMRGSEHNDSWILTDEGEVRTASNHAGGVVAGMTTGMPLVARIAFKPTPSIACGQETLNLESGKQEMLAVTGRHDPCIAVRAVPVVEAAAAIGLLNLINLDSSVRSDELADLRSSIDTLDIELIRLINTRMDISEKIGQYKTERNMPIHHPEREQEIIDRLREGTSPEIAEYIEELYGKIFEWSRKRQES